MSGSARWLRLAALCLAGRAAVGAQTPAPPLDVGLEERTGVQLVLLDVVAVDRQGATVPDLAREEFEVRVEGRAVELVSLDVACAGGATADPIGTWNPERALEAPLRDGPVRLVLVFDYFHMESAAEALDAAERALDQRRLGGEEHMIVSLGHVLRVELPLSADLARAHEALARMRTEPALYAGNYGRLTERPFFERLRMLLDLLERVPGRKSIVLFSGPFQPDGFYHDPELRALSALAATARTAVYPVDTGGLRTPLDPAFTWLGGPELLRRLANETGGRMTADTNDLTLAYARARRDLGCTYTLGIRDVQPRLDRARRAFVSVARPGVRVIQPGAYVVRSRERRARALFDTAAMAPDWFERGAVALRARLVEPAGRRRWSGRIEVDLPAATSQRRLHGFVRSASGSVVRTFERDVGPAAESIVEAFALPPGHYTVSVVLSVPDAAAPLAATLPLGIPPIPR